MNAGVWFPFPFFLFIQPGAQAHGMAPPTIRVALPTSSHLESPSQTCPRSVFYVILDPVNIRHHSDPG